MAEILDHISRNTAGMKNSSTIYTSAPKIKWSKISEVTKLINIYNATQDKKIAFLSEIPYIVKVVESKNKESSKEITHVNDKSRVCTASKKATWTSRFKRRRLLTRRWLYLSGVLG